MRHPTSRPEDARAPVWCRNSAEPQVVARLLTTAASHDVGNLAAVGGCARPLLLARRAALRKLLRNRLSTPEVPAERADVVCTWCWRCGTSRTGTTSPSSSSDARLDQSGRHDLHCAACIRQPSDRSIPLVLRPLSWALWLVSEVRIGPRRRRYGPKKAPKVGGPEHLPERRPRIAGPLHSSSVLDHSGTIRDLSWRKWGTPSISYSNFSSLSLVLDHPRSQHRPREHLRGFDSRSHR